MDPLVLLATELLDVEVLVRTVAPTVAVALAPGGPHTNVKQQRMEDSLAVLVHGDGVVSALVADAHHGAGAGERLTRQLGGLLQQGPPQDAGALLDLVLQADERACRFSRDQSQSTLLVAVAHGRTVHWVSVADSLLLTVGTRGVTRVNPVLTTFAGGTFPLRSLLNHPRAAQQQHVAHGTLELLAGETLLLASDGIEEEMTALPLGEVAGLLASQRGLEQGATALLRRWSDVARGGGRDNVAAVLVRPG